MTKSKNTNNPVREIRGNLDARTGEEQDWKGNDTTHNKRAHHSKKKDTAINHLNRTRSNSHASGL